jgi:hypothetical protein
MGGLPPDMASFGQQMTGLGVTPLACMLLL